MSAGAADYVPPKTSMRLIAIVVGLLVVTNVITAVGVYYGTAPKPAAQSMTVIGPWTSSEQTKFLPVLDAFTNATGIKVTYSYARQEDLQLILPVQFSASRAPGDVVFMTSSFIKTNGPTNGTDLTGVVDKSAYSAGALNPVTGSDGKIYGAAYTGKVKPGFWYRQSFFTAHSLTPPTTWSEFLTLLSTIKNIPGIVNPIVTGDGVGWPISDVTEHFIATFGGASMHRNLTAGTQSWTSASVHDLFANRIVPLLAAGDFSPPLTWDSTALNGWWGNSYALYFMGSWITGMVPDPSDLRVLPLPTQTGVSPGIVFAADYMFIPKYAAHPDAAKQLLRFLASKDGQTVQVKQGGHLATVLGIDASVYPTVDAKVAQTLVGKEVLPDLDDTKGNNPKPFQNTFWSQLKVLWTSSNPSADLNSVLAAIQAQA